MNEKAPQEINHIFKQSEKKLILTIICVSIIFVGKFLGAIFTNSLALFSDSWHLLTDIASLILSFWGLKIGLKAANNRYTFGYYRFSILTALINNISLIIISIYIFYKAIVRYFSPIDVQPEGMIIFSILGLIVNTIIVLNLRNNSNNINVKSVFLHFFGDALSDIGVLIGGLIIYFTHLSGVDTLLSGILACLILKNAFKMTIECTRILLEAAPEEVSIDELKSSIKNLGGIMEVTDVHIWSLSKEILSMTAHVSIQECTIENCEKKLHEIQHLLKEKFNIAHSTIQFEKCTCGSCFHSKPDHRKCCNMCIDKCENHKGKIVI
ncbi:MULTISPECIES: cation diffusion facilitator family transporter [unclassified Clostridium]|uniref:cation diffusion facilitator family transporter n=1 Tax=unclassified Clostridium TaxID=2614128 RepID=UPI0002972F4B|nr:MULTISPECIES: cation diffusion facilitator family transporter [unclassified Clostridium]EKQ57517.1 MAG: cation diffusion facilitator family transporter [Clostridium sp. Maddingley MBC34-26]